MKCYWENAGVIFTYAEGDRAATTYSSVKRIAINIFTDYIRDLINLKIYQITIYYLLREFENCYFSTDKTIILLF